MTDSKPQKPKNKKRSKKSQGESLLKEERINNFDDKNNEYLCAIIKRARNLRKKVKHSEKIQKKVDGGAVVQKEEKETLANKKKMEFAVKELEQLIFSMKKLAISEKAEQLRQNREQKRQDKAAERSFDSRAEKLEKELLKKARDQLEELEEKNKLEIQQTREEADREAEQRTSNAFLELHFASKFVQSINDKELLFLFNEINHFLENDAKSQYFLPASQSDLTYLQTLVMQILPGQSQIGAVSSAKDEFANSENLFRNYCCRSEDPVDGVNAVYSFRRLRTVTKAIATSSIFYNRFPQSKPAQIANIIVDDSKAGEGFLPSGDLNGATENTGTAAAKANLRNSGKSDVGSEKKDDGKRKDFEVPKRVPVEENETRGRLDAKRGAANKKRGGKDARRGNKVKRGGANVGRGGRGRRGTRGRGVRRASNTGRTRFKRVGGKDEKKEGVSKAPAKIAVDGKMTSLKTDK
ncbi:hypothetical protein MHBO_000282 [Bonamia ostreae]|uniref:Uncharacterized protein n=1 Tax=Bonamia ostreae TaxID=126728 RepID=A0ABV2AF46_9EUKA